jgi:hypothetical protein
MTDQETLITNGMILWEAFLDDEKKHSHIYNYREDHGSVQTRFDIANLAASLEEGWDFLTDEVKKHHDIHCFDFDYAPIFLKTCINENLTLHDDWKERLINIEDGQK